MSIAALAGGQAGEHVRVSGTYPSTARRGKRVGYSHSGADIKGVIFGADPNDRFDRPDNPARTEHWQVQAPPLSEGTIERRVKLSQLRTQNTGHRH